MSSLSNRASRRSPMLRIALAMLFATGSAHATDQDFKLAGNYQLVTTQTCVLSPFQLPPATGFDPVTRRLLSNGETILYTGTGQLRLGLDGRATLTEGRLAEISVAKVAAGDMAFLESRFSCNGSYRVQGRKLAIGLTCDLKQASAPGVAITVGPLNFEGMLSANLLSLNLAGIDGDLQTITASVNGNPVQQRQRVCTQTALLNGTSPGPATR